ncbi:lymphatic vessel endothelial hyaluronic acid receptor 1a isoform X2 [Dunckerocampus dactyliophorus]|uniref:lymphatic vessel endothelial hyaluronic acid receptor 1a isoform X2 n=1 Tax=Dunckerocampus dactyliophorus TaxID=161453 RepID=UPI002407384C|nr:lymphatic vessel endothelial hyaluronic acid receptor 1a isoform X2 [Dunckerocampus dactyliophorus]
MPDYMQCKDGGLCTQSQQEVIRLLQQRRLHVLHIHIKALSISAVFSEIKEIKLRVFPAKSIAGVFQVSYLNELNQPEYAFNITDARDLCLSLGVNIASKDQVLHALDRGLETCRFGWIDEHFVVIPRVNALSNCGQNQTGLVKWRAAVTRKFDVFCFNESAQPEEAMTTRIFESSKNPTLPPFLNIFNFSLPSDLSLLDSLDGVELARVVGGEQSSGRGRVVLITSVCAVLLLAIAVLAYFKIKTDVHRADLNQKSDYIEAKEWTSVKIAEQDDRREVGDIAS